MEFKLEKKCLGFVCFFCFFFSFAQISTSGSDGVQLSSLTRFLNLSRGVRDMSARIGIKGGE